MQLIDLVQVLSSFASAWVSSAPADKLAPLPLRKLNLNGRGLLYTDVSCIRLLNVCARLPPRDLIWNARHSTTLCNVAGVERGIHPCNIACSGLCFGIALQGKCNHVEKSFTNS